MIDKIRLERVTSKAYKMFETNNFTRENIINEFSFEERVALFDNLCVHLNDECFSLLLTNEEIISAIHQDLFRDYPTDRMLKNLSTLSNFDALNLALLTNRTANRELLDNICYLESDNLKLKLLTKLKLSRSQITEIICSFESDGLKQSFLNQLKTAKGKIISSFKSEQLKEQYLKKYSFFLKPTDKVSIISSFSNNEIKEKYFNQNIRFLNSEEKTEIILSFNDDKLKELYLESYFNSFEINDRARIVASFDSDDNKRKYFSFIETDEDKEWFLLAEGSTEFKVSVLLTYNDRELLFDNLKNYPDLKFAYLSKCDDFEFIRKVIEHEDGMDVYPDYSLEYNSLVKIYSDKLNLNKEHLDLLIQKVGYRVLRYLDNSNIISTINLNDNEFKKYLSLFNDDNIVLNKETVNDILNSLLQREFKIKNPKIINIFTTIESLIIKEDKTKIISIIDNISKTISIEEVLKKNNLTMENFIDGLLDNDKKMLNLLHEFTDSYIKIERNIYVKNNLDEAKKMSFKTRATKDSVLELILKLESVDSIVKKFVGIDKTKLTPEEKTLVDDKNLLKEILNFKKQPSNDILMQVKPNLKLFNKLFSKMYELGALGSYYQDPAAKYEEILPNINCNFLLNVMAEINVDKLKTIFNDELIFNDLKNTLQKYKYLGWGDTFNKLEDRTDLYFDNSTAASLISNFIEIKEEQIKRSSLDKKNLDSNLTYFLDVSECYTSDGLLYRNLLGKTDYNYIRRNIGPHSSSLKKDKRLELAIKKIKTMYNRNQVTIPTFDTNIELPSGRNINVVVGNTTNMMNLTYGERTESCMRIGGAGESLFDYCLESKNGFHIRFSNPNNNEFVSRVSGFRMGNTIFLNQLRNSVSDFYTDSDVVSACMDIARKLIEKGRDSGDSIDNVVVTDSYALRGQDLKSCPLKIEPVTKLAPCYCDILDSAILLASTSENDTLVPIKLNQKEVKQYDIQRDKIKEINNQQNIFESISQIQAIDQLIGNVPLENISVNIPDNLVKCYVGEDWYYAIDKDSKTYEYVMENRQTKNLAIEEMNNVKREKVFGEINQEIGGRGK